MNLLESVLETADALLGVTEYYEDRLNGENRYFAAKDLSQKPQVERDFRALYRAKEEIKNLPEIPKDASLLMTGVDLINVSYEKIISFAGLMIEALRNSVTSEEALSEVEINKYIQSFQAFQN